MRDFSDLEGGSWTYNDACSLSGYYGLLNKLAESGTDESFFGRIPLQFPPELHRGDPTGRD